MPRLRFAAPRLRFGPVRALRGMDAALLMRKGRARAGPVDGKRPLPSGGPVPGRSGTTSVARGPAIGLGLLPGAPRRDQLFFTAPASSTA
ncbi:MAG: hypothetical protein ACOVME_08810, partial [Rhodobacter sp.]